MQVTDLLNHNDEEEELRRLWPLDRPLPLPSWGKCSPQTLHIASVEVYENLASRMEHKVQLLLEKHNYNTVSNFVRMYEEYCESETSGQLSAFYRNYEPPITPKHHTCVGLGIELLDNLKTIDTCLGDKLYLVSSEEAIDSPRKYMSGGAPPVLLAEKEHVLVAMKVCINGRPGIVLLDPGYHVARVITVMQDGKYPHTGWFTQKQDDRSIKEYSYTWDNRGQYVVWNALETMKPTGISREVLNLIYVEKPFYSAIDCAERRNLVYTFKTLLARDAKGHVLAGLYFSLESKDHVTIFCHQEEGQMKRKVPFAIFLKPEISSCLMELIDICAYQLRMTTEGLLDLLKKLAAIMNDTQFIQQVLEINEKIEGISADN